MNKSYLGKAGQLYVMSEFLIRGWNVAIPEVDTGTDVLMIQDNTHDIQPIQVKTSLAKPQKRNPNVYEVQFYLPIKQLEITAYTLQYAFVVRLATTWANLVFLIPNDRLFLYYQQNLLGNPNKNNSLLLTIRVENSENGKVQKASLKNLDLTPYINAFPVLG